jgi:3-methyladenine DNA glycosylase AlkC
LTKTNIFSIRKTDKALTARALFEKSEDFLSKGVALGILSFYGIEDYEKVLPFFEASASSADWNLRELAQMFFRKLIRKWPDKMKEYLLKLTESKDPNIRRFVSETLRPVKENRWFYKRPTYSLSILRNLFKESAEYPRTSVGNNLSDLARHLPDLVFELVKELVASGDRNSYWIAYSACRNLVRKEPIRVMNLLRVEEYRYKKRVYTRSECSRD